MISQPQKIKVGVVGIGFGQQVHVSAFRADPRCEVVAICASTLERASAVAHRLGIPQAFGDWQIMLQQAEIQAISIATPPKIQADIAIAALLQHKAVFCEKPLAISKAAALEMMTVAEPARVAHMVDFEFPEIEAWQQAKSILEGGGIGHLRHITVSWQVETYANKKGLESWKTCAEEGGGILNSFVSHVFYYLEWLIGPIKQLSAHLGRAPNDSRQGDTVDVLCLELESGVTVSLSISGQAFLGHGHRIACYGDEGTLVLDNPTSDYVNGFQLLHGTRAANAFEVVGSSNRSMSEEGRIAMVARVMARFITWIETGVPQQPSFKEGFRVQSLLTAAQQSHELGCWVKTPLAF